MEDNKCGSCLYCGEKWECWLEKLEGINQEECKNKGYKFYEERME